MYCYAMAFQGPAGCREGHPVTDPAEFIQGQPVGHDLWGSPLEALAVPLCLMLTQCCEHEIKRKKQKKRWVENPRAFWSCLAIIHAV